MLADRTLLSVTLVATFAAGGASGWAARDRRADAPFRPTDARQVYARQLRALRDRGWDDAEVADALRVHQEYLDAYDSWWKVFCDERSANLDAVDRRFEADLGQLEARVAARLAARR